MPQSHRVNDIYTVNKNEIIWNVLYFVFCMVVLLYVDDKHPLFLEANQMQTGTMADALAFPLVFYR